jgi:hypothetical protein
MAAQNTEPRNRVFVVKAKNIQKQRDLENASPNQKKLTVTEKAEILILKPRLISAKADRNIAVESFGNTPAAYRNLTGASTLRGETQASKRS